MILQDFFYTFQSSILATWLIAGIVILLKRRAGKKVSSDDYVRIILDAYLIVSCISILYFILTDGSFIFGNQISDLYIPLSVAVVILLNYSLGELKGMGDYLSNTQESAVSGSNQSEETESKKPKSPTNGKKLKKYSKTDFNNIELSIMNRLNKLYGYRPCRIEFLQNELSLTAMDMNKAIFNLKKAEAITAQGSDVKHPTMSLNEIFKKDHEELFD